MNILPSVILVILAMVIQGLLQFAPASFLIFRHYAFGKTNKNKADKLCSYFIFGIEIMVAIMLIVAVWAMQQIREKNFFDEKWFLGIMAGIFIVDAILAIFYFKKSGTKLNFVLVGRGNIRKKLQNVDNSFAALKCGIKSACKELFLSLPLVIFFANEICFINYNDKKVLAIILVFCYIVAAMLPVYKIKFEYKFGKNLAEIQRKRVKNKVLVKSALCSTFVIMAILIVVFRIING